MNSFWSAVLFIVTALTIHNLPLSKYMPNNEGEVKMCNANGDAGTQRYYTNLYAFCLGAGIRDSKWRRIAVGATTLTGPPSQEEFCSYYMGCCGEIDSQGYHVVGRACYGSKWDSLPNDHARNSIAYRDA